MSWLCCHPGAIVSKVASAGLPPYRSRFTRSQRPALRLGRAYDSDRLKFLGSLRRAQGLRASPEA
ncbi:hypothetical protein HRbin11_00964 [bacterium HR11]|nr:hypothetical protein HRbin11_00964 [bacterium HR11]